MSKVIQLALLYLSTICSLQSQNINTDSLIALLPTDSDSLNYHINSQLVVSFFYTDLERAKKHIDREIEIALASGFKERLADGYIHQASYYANAGNADSSFLYFDKALSIIESENIVAKRPVLYTNYGTICSNLGYWDKGLEMLQNSQKAIKEYKPDTILTIHNYLSIGSIHGELKNYELSDKYYNDALVLAEAQDNQEELAWIKMMLGINKLETGDIKEAKDYFLDIIEYYEKEDMKFELARAYGNYGHSLQLQDSLLKAKEVFQHGYKLSEELGYADTTIEFLERLGAINIDLQDYKKAIPYLERALPMNVELGSIINQARDHELLAKSYSSIGKHKAAFDYLTSYIALNDSIRSDEKVSFINELETKYQTEIKEKEIKLLEEKAKRNSLEKKGMMGGILGLLGLFGALFYAMIQRMIKNKLAKEKVDQELDFSLKELDFKKQELTAYALQLAHKNELLEGIKTDVNSIKDETDNPKGLQKIVNTISINQSDDESWEAFRIRFLAVHKNFEKDVKSQFPDVSVNEIRIMALLKMQLTSKEIANILNISGEGIKKARYRLRKKLSMESNESLEALVLAI